MYTEPPTADRAGSILITNGTSIVGINTTDHGCDISAVKALLLLNIIPIASLPMYHLTW